MVNSASDFNENSFEKFNPMKLKKIFNLFVFHSLLNIFWTKSPILFIASLGSGN